MTTGAYTEKSMTADVYNIIKRDILMNEDFNEFIKYKEETLKNFKKCDTKQGLESFEKSIRKLNEVSYDAHRESTQAEDEDIEFYLTQEKEIDLVLDNEKLSLFKDLVKLLKDNCECKA